MFRIVIFAGFVFAAWRWGDWRNWEKYYSTILYFILISILQTLVTYDHYLWKFNPSDAVPFLNNHIAITIAVSFVVFTSTALIFLANYPNNHHQYWYILLWICLYVFIEIITMKTGLITHHHGWTLGWSIAVNVLTFPMLRLHFLRPLLTWVLTFIFFTTFCVIFGVAP